MQGRRRAPAMASGGGASTATPPLPFWAARGICAGWRAAGRGPAGPARPQERKAQVRNLPGMRQWVEAIFGILKDQPSLERHGGRTPVGVFTRVAQRLLAMVACTGATAPAKRPASAR
jgi:hypothetical protein